MTSDQQLDEIRRRVRMIDGELSRLSTEIDPALRWVPAETLRMHLEMAAQDMRDYVATIGGAPTPPSVPQLEAENSRLRDALAWYGEQARLCRLIHSEGDAGRHALASDGGKRARESAILAAHAQGFVDDVQETMRLAALSAEPQSTF